MDEADGRLGPQARQSGHGDVPRDAWMKFLRRPRLSLAAGRHFLNVSPKPDSRSRAIRLLRAFPTDFRCRAGADSPVAAHLRVTRGETL